MHMAIPRNRLNHTPKLCSPAVNRHTLARLHLAGDEPAACHHSFTQLASSLVGRFPWFLVSRVAVAMLTASFQLAHAEAPTDFESAKLELRKIYSDRKLAGEGDLYCGCPWKWSNRTGGKMDLSACGYVSHAQPKLALRLDWGSIVPSEVLGRGRSCWEHGGQKYCESNDPTFRAMQGDLHNLAPVVGEVEADRNGAEVAELASVPLQYGICSTKIDRSEQRIEPRDEVKGYVARASFYMYDRYGLQMPEEQQQLLMDWNARFPVTRWEWEREQRAAAVMGNHNPFVTGARSWSLDYKPTAEGLSAGEREELLVHGASSFGKATTTPSAGGALDDGPALGDSRTMVYRLPHGCPGYGRVNKRNRVFFDTVREAQDAGYVIASDCQ